MILKKGLWICNIFVFWKKIQSVENFSVCSLFFAVVSTPLSTVVC